MVVFKTTCAIRTFHHQCCEIEFRSLRGVLDTTLCVTAENWEKHIHIFSINGLTNIINKPTYFDSRTGNSSLLDPILITDNVPLIDSDTIHIDRKISDHNKVWI